MSTTLISPILDFYGGQENPSGYLYLDIVYRWDSVQWDNNHTFIQWLFPTNKASGFNPLAPLLDQSTARQLAFDYHAEIMQAAHRFIDFLGLEIDVFVGIKRNNHTVCRLEKHNLLRITRFLYSMRLLGFGLLAKDLYTYLLCNMATPSIVYWQEAMNKGLWE